MFHGRPLTDIIGEIENGQFLHEATKAFNDVMEGVNETGKAGKIKITIDVRPTGKNTVSVVAAVDEKIPEHTRPVTTFYVDKQGQLTRRDPNQPDLPLRSVVDNDAAPPRQVLNDR
jgi:hypothetical protein